MADAVTYRATGKRKTSVARVTLTPGVGTVVINGRAIDAYFGRKVLETIALMPFETTRTARQVRRQGQRVRRRHLGQAGAMRHGIARALCEADETLRTPLKRAGFLTRDDRKVERKKAGFHKARKKPQFSKR